MIILGIETSCDETAGAVVQKTGNRIKILSNIVTSSAQLQAKYGGVIPEQAAREQIKAIIPVIEEALQKARIRLPRRFAPRNDEVEIDAIAVTYGPGLIGSLLVGVEAAKVLAKVWKKPLIPVNHLLAHFYANWIGNGSSVMCQVSSLKKHVACNMQHKTPSFPAIGLLVSGGHTDLVLFASHGKYTYLGGTRDDAAGECFDKCARLLGLPYPGGPAISKLAKKGNPLAFNLPRPMIDSKDFDFSFSGLKTAVSRIISEHSENSDSRRIRLSDNQNVRNSEIPKIRSSGFLSSSESFRADLAASVEQGIIDVLVEKTIKAAQKYNVKQIIVAGGVAANQKLTSDLKFKIYNLNLKIDLSVPPAELCTDNAAMVAAAAFFNPKGVNPLKLEVNPNLSLV